MLNKRKSQRGKRRFEYEFDDQDFATAFNYRRRNATGENTEQASNQTQENGEPFSKKGEDIKIEISVNFHEAIKGVAKGVKLDRNIRCPTCNGTRSDDNSQLSNCYSCSGTGVKIDQLFRQKTK